MGILKIEPVTRQGMRLLLSFYGVSETGKTLSALKVAAGIEPDPAKRGMLDTEGGQRGRAYVDQIDGGYLYGALTPPFTPERYMEAVSEFEAAGVNVLVIDSVSHAWFAEGGVLDMVDASTLANDMAKWKAPKRRLTRMTNRLLSSDMHIILCSRAKQPLVDNGKGANPRYTPGPITPIQEKTLRYDMTVMAHMLGDGKFTIAAPAGKCPGSLRKVFSGHEVMGEDVGRSLASWVQSQGGKSPEHRALEIAATEASEGGSESLKAFLAGLDEGKRGYLRPNADNYRSIARASDAEKTRQDDERRAAQHESANMDDPFAPPAAARPDLSGDASRALTMLRACSSEAELDAVLDELPIETCRELGSEALEECRAAIQARGAE